MIALVGFATGVVRVASVNHSTVLGSPPLISELCNVKSIPDIFPLSNVSSHCSYV